MKRKSREVAKYLLLLLFIDSVWPREAHAYLDPGTGSMLISAVLGIFATALFLLKSLQYKVKAFVLGLFGVSVAEKERYGIVFYSEGSTYWSTFEPVLKALDELQVECTYLTSGEDDPGLSYQSANVRTRYIGKTYGAFAMLNVMEADVCVLTTPGLDVMQIKRSKGVRHYIHLVHSVSDIGTYKQFSFDYFDTVLTANEHQITALRELEKLRGTTQKTLLRVGCTYMDGLQARAAAVGPAPEGDGICVLVAPTWGANGLFSRFGARLPKMLLDAGFEVIVRPHPQSRISEKDELASVTDELVGYPKLSWDDTADPFESMRKANVLVSDLSGIVFDFAFIFGKPVISLQFTYDSAGMEASDLPGGLWETTVLDKIGFRIGAEDMDSLPDRIRDMVGTEEFRQSIRLVMEESLFNPGEAGEAAARQILEIQQRVADPVVTAALDGPAAAVS